MSGPPAAPPGGGVLIAITVAISIAGGRVSGRGPFAQKRVVAGVACTGLVYYMHVTCPVPVLLLCPYHMEDVGTCLPSSVITSALTLTGLTNVCNVLAHRSR